MNTSSLDSERLLSSNASVRPVNRARVQPFGIGKHHEHRKLRDFEFPSENNRREPFHFKIAKWAKFLVRDLARKDILMERQPAELHAPANGRRPLPVGR